MTILFGAILVLGWVALSMSPRTAMPSGPFNTAYFLMGEAVFIFGLAAGAWRLESASLG
ncbi:MAG TPA: hypothetical protein VEJ67_06905 [Candidatus Cybelea sp.]|nr:hypothetical protein [Candidatus Cybelea sp.]